jgi:tryptophan halogenase
MGYPTDLSHARAAWPRMAEAQAEFGTIAEVAERALLDLPDHRSLVEAMIARAAAPVRDRVAAKVA